MSTELPTFVDRFRRPEYTGENRCTPCTIVNVVIAVVLGAALTLVAMPVGIGVLAVSLAAIYLRGYLVPGTPALTKRYFPNWFLAAFDKREASETVGGESDVEPEAVLSTAGVVRPCEEVDDLCLDDAFRSAWHESMERVEESGAEKSDLGTILDVDEEDLTFEEHDQAFLARLDGRHLGQWESHAALVADLAAARVLRDWYPDWEALTVDDQSRVLSGLRIFLEECPECGGTVVPEQETVESCCRSMDVVAANCQSCDARLLEVEQAQ
jgi:hypothetical protein